VEDDAEANRREPLLRRAWSWKARGVRRALRGRFGAIVAVLAVGRVIAGYLKLEYAHQRKEQAFVACFVHLDRVESSWCLKVSSSRHG
jgi:hypothetical protein